MKTVNNYRDLYLKVDFLLLRWVFETFREESIIFFELDPEHYLSFSG